MEEAPFNEKKKRKLFTSEEDAFLKYLVSQYGTHNFRKIASMMKNRTARQIRERYKNYLSPELVNGPWNYLEDQLLIQKYRELGQKWSLIVKFFPTRSEINIKNRWKSICLRETGKKQDTNMRKTQSPKDNNPAYDESNAIFQREEDRPV